MADVVVITQLPGRVRLRVAGLYGRPDRAHGIERALATLRGIQRVQANPGSGRVLVEYAPGVVSLEAILETTATAPAVPPPPARKREQQDGEPGMLASVIRIALSGAVLGRFAFQRLVGGGALLAGTPFLSLASVATLVAGYPIFRRGLMILLKERRTDMDLLISSATFTSLILRESFTGLVVVWLINLGDLAEALTLRKSRRAIRDLLSVGDAWVWIIVNDQEVRVPVAEITVDTLVSVHEGEKIAVDGVVEDGEATVNQAAITGEAMPVARVAGDRVFAGTIVEAGHIIIRTTAVGDDTAVGRIIQRVEEAREHRAPIQCSVDHFSEHFVPWSFALAATVFLLTRDFRRSLSMLVIACPCAAGLSTPTAIGAAIANAARRGVLIKGGLYLELAGDIDALVFDKTGTLTTGIPRVSEVVSCAPDVAPARVIALAAAAERHSHHPFAAAIQRHLDERGIVAPAAADYETLVAVGVRANVDGISVAVGGRRLLSQYEIDVPATQAGYEEQALLWVVADGRLLGWISIEEEIRAEARRAVAELRAAQMRRLVVATGDRGAAAARIASRVGVSEYLEGVLPEDKLTLIHQLQADGHQVAMVGDGINDAPALAAATIGFAMGTVGTDVAIEAADIALAGDDLCQVPSVIRLSRHTLDVVHHNFAAAIGINLLGIGLSAFGLMSPLVGAVVHNLSTVAVVLHSAQLVAYRDPGAALPSRVNGEVDHLLALPDGNGHMEHLGNDAANADGVLADGVVADGVIVDGVLANGGIGHERLTGLLHEQPVDFIVRHNRGIEENEHPSRA
ncbi:MAG: cadmium-translocating P-type ATPase [Chloroflexi bacterium]|nr:cadmium-translocating P-type ATPase [Chloroflexota bacterium]